VTMPMDTSSFPPPPPLIGMQKRKREENAGHVIPDRHVTHPPSFAPNTASGVVPASHHASSEKPILPLPPGNISAEALHEYLLVAVAMRARTRET
jgi:hypothetical protein